MESPAGGEVGGSENGGEGGSVEGDVGADDGRVGGRAGGLWVAELHVREAGLLRGGQATRRRVRSEADDCFEADTQSIGLSAPKSVTLGGPDPVLSQTANRTDISTARY